MSNTLQHRILLVVVLLVGVIVGYVVPKPAKSIADPWLQYFNEEQDHKRIMTLQDALAKQGIAKDPGELARQLDAQLRIEDLIVKSREAEYAKYTPFTTLFAAGLGFVGGIVGALITNYFRSRQSPEAGKGR
jgi:hypothetical protein